MMLARERQGATGAAARDGAYAEACSRIARAILAMGGPQAGEPRRQPARRDALAEIRRVCGSMSLPRMPAYRDILAAAGTERDRALLGRVLAKKPAKTASGVAVVTVMPMPYACPHGRCTYCPGGEASNTPNSYTGHEPPAMGAITAGYDPRAQAAAGVERLAAAGHSTSKIELVVVGGTFLFMPKEYTEWFAKSCYDALNGFESAGIEEAKGANESAARRCVGLAIETKPDYCGERHVDSMLALGATRVEIGVQTLREGAYRLANRGHTLADVVEAFRAARDAGYKVCAHMMPGLPGVSAAEDEADFARLWDDAALRPDMLKIYPTLVLAGTPLQAQYERGEYEPYTDGRMARLLAAVKARVPRWVRIMRVQRELPPSAILAGPRAGNLRQAVRGIMRAEGTACRCIRCREAGLAWAGGGGGGVGVGGPGGEASGGGRPRRAFAHGASGPPRLEVDRADYDASGGREAFVSYVDGDGRIYGFVRLRRPSPAASRPEVAGADCGIVRELHVYGRSLGVGEAAWQGAPSQQHAGLGRRLMAEAERIARGEFGADRLLVISAVGTRGYYRRLGYGRCGPYMAKDLRGEGRRAAGARAAGGLP